MKALFLFAFISSASALEPDAKTVAAAAPSAQFSRLPWGPTHQRRLERHYYVQRRSYGDNVGDAFFGMLIGFVLLVLVPIMIVAAELQAVKFSRLLTRAEQSTIPNVTSSQVSPKFEGHMIHAQGALFLDSPSFVDGGTDVPFDLSHMYGGRMGSRPLRIERKVEVYQWKERTKKSNDRTVYEYSTEWVEDDVDSSRFKVPHGHHNPPRMHNPGEPPLYTTTFDRDDANLGAFKLGTDAVSRAKWWTPCPLPKLDLPPKSFGVIQNNAKIIDGLLYILPPKQRKEMFGVGDMRITYRTVECPPPGTDGTIVAVQSTGAVVAAAAGAEPSTLRARPSNFRAFKESDAKKILAKKKTFRALPGIVADDGTPVVMGTPVAAEEEESTGGCCASIFGCVGAIVGTDVLLIAPGPYSPRVMFNTAFRDLDLAMYAMRTIFAVLFIVAFYLVLQPISAVFSFLPFVSDLMNSLFLLAAIVVGLACSAIVTACAWLVAKPARACLLFVALAASLFFGSAIDAANMYGVPLSEVLASGDAFIPGSAYVAPALCLCAAAAGGFFAVLEWVEGKRFEKMVKADIMSVGAVRSQSGRHLL